MTGIQGTSALFLVAAIIGGLGLVCMLSRKSLLGLLVGIQLLVMGATMAFVSAGLAPGAQLSGHVAGLFVTLGGVAQLVGGYCLAIRLFYLRNRIDMNELRSLKK